MKYNNYRPTRKEQEILDLARERAITNVENFEGIKAGIVREAALSLLRDAGTPNSKIAGLLIKNLSANADDAKKTGISNKLIYYALRTDEFKETKDQIQMNRRLGKGGKMKSRGSSTRTGKIPNPTCMDVVAQEIKKIREESPELSNKQIRTKLLTLESIKQFKKHTLDMVFPELIPVYKQGNEKVIAAVDTTKVTIPPYLPQNEQEIGASMIKRIEQFLPILQWLSGMDEPDRTTFYKHLPKGKSYTLALQEKCRDHIRDIVKMMLDRNLETFLKYTDEFAHLIKVFDEELYNEKLLREKNRHLSSV